MLYEFFTKMSDNILKTLFNDKDKIKVFKDIQYNLLSLEPNSNDEAINNIISQIPQEFLTGKEDLMAISQLFFYYSRNTHQKNKGNTIKLFEKIIDQAKTYLQDESSFFWNICGGIIYFKLWLHEEGLISIEKIVNSLKQSDSIETIEFFLPELIEKVPEIFEKDFKYKIPPEKYSEEYISSFKELRKKYFDWVRNSNDYNDPNYSEIEKDPLRYAIKTDNIESFQKIISNLNMSIDSEINDSIIDNLFRLPRKMSLISFSIEYDSINIFKYLCMNDAKFISNDIYGALKNRNYEMVHIIESKMKETFANEVLLCGISSWNEDIIEYAINNYPHDFFNAEDNGIDCETEISKSMIDNTFYSMNFIFLESTLFPFFEKHPNFVKKNIYEIICFSFSDNSCFFLNKLLKYPELNVNLYPFSKNKMTLLLEAIRERNEKAVEVLLNVKNIDINSYGSQNFTPFQCVCMLFFDMKIIKLFCNHPDFDINLLDDTNVFNAFDISVSRGNSYAVEYILDHYNNEKIILSSGVFMHCIEKHNLMCLKLILKYKLKYLSKETIIRSFNTASDIIGYNDEDNKTFTKILDEL